MCQDPKRRSEESVGLLPAILPPHPQARIKILRGLEGFRDYPYCLFIFKVQVVNKHRITKICTI